MTEDFFCRFNDILESQKKSECHDLTNIFDFFLL